MTGLSPLAKRVAGGLDPADGRIRKPWGLCLHTTGRGVDATAAKTNRKPIDVALEIYLRSQRGELNPYRWGGPAYVIDHDGTIYQLAPDHVMTAHCGGPDRSLYLSGAWIDHVSPAAFAHWRAAWPGHESPQDLYPSHSANTDYIGAEMLPLGSGFGGAPRAPGMLFTQAQHDAAIALAEDLASRHGWPAGWGSTPRLVSHEDVQLVERHDIGGGWDIGFLRERPYFDFPYVRAALAPGVA